MISNSDVIRAIDAYCARFAGKEDYVRDLRKLIADGARCLRRDEFRCHVTCSALVTNTNGEVLMIHHRALNRWLLPGGHLEPTDISLPNTATRELSEETGVPLDQINTIANWAEIPVHIDRHTIPANSAKREPAHEHWDFCYALRFTGSVGAIAKSEVVDVKWCEPSQKFREDYLAANLVAPITSNHIP